MNRFATISIVTQSLFAIAFSLVLATSVAAQDNSLTSDCVLPTQPIVPDGNVASMDELVAAQKALKAYQGNLAEYRNCLVSAEEALDPEAEDHEMNVLRITQLYDGSVDAETATAEKFNQSVRAYNARNPKTEE